MPVRDIPAPMTRREFDGSRSEEGFLESREAVVDIFRERGVEGKIARGNISMMDETVNLDK